VPAVYDDDPLTSPSFPKIVTSDSRSYGNGRSAGAPAQAGQPADLAAYGAPTAQFASYGPAGSRPADGGAADGYGRGLADTSSAATAPRSYRPAAEPSAVSYPANGHANGQANGHQLPGHAAGTVPGFPAGQQQRCPAGQQQPARPSADRPLPAASPPTGNPYGSYVSTDLPGYPESPAPAYPQGSAAPGYPGYPAGSAIAPVSAAYSYDLPLSDSAPPLGSASGWYPEAPAAMAPAPSAGVSGPLPQAGGQAGGGLPGHEYGNGHRGPSGYAPGPYADGHHDLPGYPPAGYGVRPDVPGNPPASEYPARQPDAAGYLPPEFYGGTGYGGQPGR
jgi:hypothetical protein